MIAYFLVMNSKRCSRVSPISCHKLNTHPETLIKLFIHSFNKRDKCIIKIIKKLINATFDLHLIAIALSYKKGKKNEEKSQIGIN